ncbi:MAG: FAD/NAD(P)-binding protein [Daejeonella sp.]|uniref:FAD/NAD(P)-binding protein n=1 Tax=Daejeonella sp. TaxID=2805397 RepID=UPI0027348F0A|nr:FAD/NAD(P)-binding protein [Daejeonella sp.]MDP3469719.1 FAD/NAD(P)-binding protein [Daejeonella sp.]
MIKIAIIGAGFSGTMIGVHLIKMANVPIEIKLINETDALNTGIAYNPYSKKVLLNVVSSRMSAFASDPDHFLNWLMLQDHFRDKDRTLIANSFLPRCLYGEYLKDIWKDALIQAEGKKIQVDVINSSVKDLTLLNDSIDLELKDKSRLSANYAIIASGNHLPGNPKIKSSFFSRSAKYFQNPWDIRSVSGINSKEPVLIIGNGLTMVDTVIGLLENGFQGKIVSISPNGFNILPHRHNGLSYTKLVEEIGEKTSLFELVKLFNKHMKLIREYGLSAEPLIDSLRPLTQTIWKRLTIDEKRIFMTRLRHLWGVARHRIPLHIHDKLQQLRIEGRLHIVSGKLLDIIENEDNIMAMYYDKKEKQTVQLAVSRVINCTGPETDLLKLDDNYLKKALLQGILSQDELKLGINADPDTFEALDSSGHIQSGLYVMGSNLKGLLWESTAVSELRVQAEKIAGDIRGKIIRGA